MLQKKPIKICNVRVNNIVISKLVKTKTNSKYLTGYLDKDKRPLVLMMPKMSGYLKTFKVEDKNNKLMPLMSGYVKTFKVEDKNNKLMYFRIDDEKLLEKYKAICNSIKDFKNIKFNALPAYDNIYIKTKIRAYQDKVYTDFGGLNMPEDDIECESFKVISNITCKYILTIVLIKLSDYQIMIS